MCYEYKQEYDVSKGEGTVEWNRRKQKHIKTVATEKGGYKSKAIRELFPSLKTVKNSNPEFQRALSLASRCYDAYDRKMGQDCLYEEPAKKKQKFREPGGGRKSVAPEVRQAAWFI